jgi:hypothetical protein
MEEVKLADTLNRAWKDGWSHFLNVSSITCVLDKSGFGYRMLQKMGWKEDKGLGKHEDGMANAVKVKRRDAGLGLGVTQDQAGDGWGSTVSSFSAVLDLLNANYGTASKIKKKKKIPNVQVRIKYDSFCILSLPLRAIDENALSTFLLNINCRK